MILGAYDFMTNIYKHRRLEKNSIFCQANIIGAEIGENSTNLSAKGAKTVQFNNSTAQAELHFHTSFPTTKNIQLLPGSVVAGSNFQAKVLTVKINVFLFKMRNSINV